MIGLSFLFFPVVGTSLSLVLVAVCLPVLPLVVVAVAVMCLPLMPLVEPAIAVICLPPSLFLVVVAVEVGTPLAVGATAKADNSSNDMSLHLS